jgi:dihydropteroate synthase
VAAALVAVERGARIVRVHDVAATADALRVWVAARPTQSQAGNLHASPS